MFVCMFISVNFFFLYDPKCLNLHNFLIIRNG